MFETIDVTGWPQAGDEAMGTKRKVWLRDPVNPREKWLFKYRYRYAQSGIHRDDDWSEKLAAEVAELLGVPHATVELATRGAERGVISRDLVGSLGAVELVPGDRVLAQYSPDFPSDSDEYRNSDHTLGRVLEVLASLEIAAADGTPVDDALESARDVYCGYLMLDALIGNTDRNPGNWGVLRYSRDLFPDLRLCPSFDHASCLGYGETDARRESLSATLGGIAGYVLKARSALYRAVTDAKPLKTHQAFEAVAAERPTAARCWLARLERISYTALADIVGRVPPAIMSDPARRFACEMLRSNRDTLRAVVLP